jgi:UDP-glucose-4-epimerase GalE
VARVLVTGGAGYIGSFGVQALVAGGHDVVVYDNLAQGHSEAIGRLQRSGIGRPEQVTLVVGDIRDREKVRATLETHRLDAVMHFAAWLIVSDSVKNPAGYYDNNVVGALSVLGAMMDVGVRRFIFSSTCATFGDPIRTPIDEDHPQRPINAYGESKLAIERALPHYDRAYGIRWVALRYFNAAGADPSGLLGEDHEPEIHLIPRAIDAATGGEGLAVFGEDYPTPDGTCQRDYVHVVDLADAHVRALQYLDAGGASRAYNLGNGRPHSVREVIAAVERVTGRAVPHRTAPRRPGDPAVLFASSDRAQRELGWQPRLADLDTIVDTAWQWRRRHPRGYATEPSSLNA